MIASLNDLMEYTELRAGERPSRRDEIAITSPGCSADEIAELRQRIPGLPDSYLEVIRQVEICGKVIGFFQLCPGSPVGASLGDRLVDCNQESTGMWRWVQRYGASIIGALEADPIAITCNPDVYQVGQILLFNHDYPDRRPAVLADNFETYLLAAGNLQSIRDRHASKSDSTRARDEFVSCLRQLGIHENSEVFAAWDEIAEMVLG